MKKAAALALTALLALTLAACGAQTAPETVQQVQAAPSVATVTPVETSSEEETDMKINVDVGGESFTATLENNAATAALVDMLESGPLVIEMSDYAGFEKVGSLGTRLPSSNRQLTNSGDIVLYNSNQIVIFYGSNSWSYTLLGRIDDLTGWAEALGSGDVTVTFSLCE